MTEKELQGLFRSGPKSFLGRTAGFTLVELLVCVAIISILTGAILPTFLRIQVQSKVSASRNNQRILTDAIEFYALDYGQYPSPTASDEDAFGVVSRVALKVLTTPVAYVSPQAFYDPFGAVKVQASAAQMTVPAVPAVAADDPFRPPTPGFNTKQSLLYFYYPKISVLLKKPEIAANAYAVVSVGPDLKDSFIVYYPFPRSLPPRSAQFGIESVADTVYDPTNGAKSGGDLAAFGGFSSIPRFLGGGK